MRVAICFSGQFRTAIESSDNIKRFIGDIDCDFFIHTWNINSQKNYNGTIIKSKPETVTQEKIEKLTSIYNPKKIEVENYYEIQKIMSNDNNSDINLFGTIPPHWYSFMKSVEYKTDYEIENDFEYDFVIKLRLDLIFPSIRRLNLELLFPTNANYFLIENIGKLNIDTIFVDDVYFLSNSKTMNIAANYFNEVKLYDLKNCSSGYYFIKHLLINGVELTESNRYELYGGQYSYAIYRPECVKYSSLIEYTKCRKCDFYYYGDMIHKSTDINYFADDIQKEYIIDNIFNIYDPTVKFYYIDELDLFFSKRIKKLI